MSNLPGKGNLAIAPRAGELSGEMPGCRGCRSRRCRNCVAEFAFSFCSKGDQFGPEGTRSQGSQHLRIPIYEYWLDHQSVDSFSQLARSTSSHNLARLARLLCVCDPIHYRAPTLPKRANELATFWTLCGSNRSDTVRSTSPHTHTHTSYISKHAPTRNHSD